MICTLVRSLADDWEAVEVTEYDAGVKTFYTVYTAAADKGRVVGKHGEHANAIRTFAQAVATKHQRKIYVEFDA